MTLTPTELGLLIAGIGLGGVIIGAVVAGGFALLNSWLSNRREHRRWEREQRFEAYAAFQGILYEASTLPAGSPMEPDMIQRRGAAVSRVDILGPHAVIDAAADYLRVSRKGGRPPELQGVVDAYLAACRKALGVKMGKPVLVDEDVAGNGPGIASNAGGTA